MTVILIRHALSQANNRENIGTPAYGNPDAELMQLGIEQARQLPAALLAQFAIRSFTIPVATSQLRRTQQTASEAGFLNQTHYALLDEIDPKTLAMSSSQLYTMLSANKLPLQVLREAAKTLESPPKETIWFSHGLRIAGILMLNGSHQDERVIPAFCEAREITL